LISFLWPKLFSSPIDLHSPIWFPQPAGPSSFHLLHDFGIFSVSLHYYVRSSFGSAWSLSDRHLAQPGLYPIVIWLSLVSIRSSFGSAWSLSDRHLAQPGLCPIVSWLSLVSVRSCRVSVRSSLGSARSLSDRSGLCSIVIWLSLVSDRSCWVSVRSSFCSASFFVWCVAGPIHSVICYSGRVLSLISHMVFLAPFWVSGAVPSTVPRVDS
jgi:hypothetical protein